MKVLDVGCGTGSLCLALAPHFREVIGIDPDERMLQLAIEKAGSEYGNVSFQPYGMLDLDKEDQFRQMDAVLCFGNTLVHLGSEEDILEFLRQAKATLKPGGKLMIQIINYDRIFNEKIDGLPTIENDSIKFVRNYHYTDRSALDFETILSIKESGEEIRNTISLFPILKDELIRLVQKAGFHDILVYGNFKRDPYLPGSIPLLLQATS
ncbi:MAG: class I SAM-dependent methyltransferase [Bacteroidetes bacterium]|nr:MAG: class I SAM-dependent methyltransferase [Bacteroidota bacterium]